MKLVIVLTVAACLQAGGSGFAQKAAIRTDSGQLQTANPDLQGRVTAENGKPLPGAAITVKETSKRTVTDSKGKFTIPADPGQTLLVSIAGYDDREILVGADKRLSIEMELNLASLLNTVIVNKGYYTTTQKLNTGNEGDIFNDNYFLIPDRFIGAQDLQFVIKR